MDIQHKFSVTDLGESLEFRMSVTDPISNYVQTMSKEIVLLKDEAVRKKLISLGWIPPKPESIKHVNIEESYSSEVIPMSHESYVTHSYKINPVDIANSGQPVKHSLNQAALAISATCGSISHEVANFTIHDNLYNRKELVAQLRELECALELLRQETGIRRTETLMED